MNEMSPIDSLKGIGEKTKAVFERAGISDIGDLLHDYPRGYESYEPIMPLITPAMRNVIMPSALVTPMIRLSFENVATPILIMPVTKLKELNF